MVRRLSRTGWIAPASSVSLYLTQPTSPLSEIARGAQPFPDKQTLSSLADATPPPSSLPPPLKSVAHHRPVYGRLLFHLFPYDAWVGDGRPAAICQRTTHGVPPATVSRFLRRPLSALNEYPSGSKGQPVGHGKFPLSGCVDRSCVCHK